MKKEYARVEIIVNGLVQGVGFRYFVLREAESLKLKGFVKNLYSGEVQVVAEGEKMLLEELFVRVKIGPMHAQVNDASISWSECKNEFNRFDIGY